MASAVGTVGLGTSLAGGVLSAFGASKSAQATSQMYSYQAQVANINSQIDTQNADYARQVGEQQANLYGMKAGQQQGQIRASQGASGLDVNSGSNADVQASQKEITQIDLGQIRQNAAKTAYDFDVQSQNDKNQAGLYTAASTNAQTAGNINVLGSIIGSAGSVASKWLQGSSMGLWSGSGNPVNVGSAISFGG